MSEEIQLENAQTSASKKKGSNMPKREREIIKVGEISIPKMEEIGFELLWLPTAVFKQKLADYKTLVESKTGAKSARQPKSRRLMELNKIIDTNVKYVKSMINVIHAENATAYYANFGIIKVNGTYQLPCAMEERTEALKVMAKELTARAWKEEKVSAAFWTAISDEYNELMSGSYSGAGNISVMVGNKQALRADLLLALKSIKKHLEAHYPTDYENQWRNFGFLRERFA